MNHPVELTDFWAYREAWSKSHEPEDWPVSQEAANMYRWHLDRLAPLAESGNILAKYAMASIYLLDLLYPDIATREKNIKEDSTTMTRLLCECAENGMVFAFDNLVTSGTGEIGDSARAAANDYEHIMKADWDEESNMPVYTPEWMEGAMKLWRKKRGLKPPTPTGHQIQ